MLRAMICTVNEDRLLAALLGRRVVLMLAAVIVVVAVATALLGAVRGIALATIVLSAAVVIDRR